MPKKKNKKVKIQSVASLRRKAMKLWTEKVKDIQGRVCAICGSKDGAENGNTRKDGKPGKSFINSHHIEDRTNYSLRWDLLNGIALCPSCHEFSKNSAHRAPVWFIDWLVANRPRVVEYVRTNRASRPQTADGYKREDMMAIIAGLSKTVTDEELSVLNLPKPSVVTAPLPCQPS